MLIINLNNALMSPLPCSASPRKCISKKIPEPPGASGDYRGPMKLATESTSNFQYFKMLSKAVWLLTIKLHRLEEGTRGRRSSVVERMLSTHEVLGSITNKPNYLPSKKKPKQNEIILHRLNDKVLCFGQK